MRTPRGHRPPRHWMHSNNPNASVAAAIALLDRGWGKPDQDVTGPNGAALTIRMVITGVVREIDDDGSRDDRTIFLPYKARPQFVPFHA